MCESRDVTSKRTPLRNSNSANKPFRSPLCTVLTPNNNETPKHFRYKSPLTKTGTPKRSSGQICHVIKRRRIGDDPSIDSPSENIAGGPPADDKLLALEKRISAKKLTLEDLKRQSNYIKKNNVQDLRARIDLWRTGCKEALFDLHKNTVERTGQKITVSQVLATLGIPEKIVQLSPDECDTIC